MVSAYSSRDRIVVGHVKTSDKSNEITAIPRLLKKLRLAGAVVTIDAVGCQTNIVKTIAGRGADYLIALKGNQGGMLEAVEDRPDFEIRDEDFPAFVGWYLAFSEKRELLGNTSHLLYICRKK